MGSPSDDGKGNKVRQREPMYLRGRNYGSREELTAKKIVDKEVPVEHLEHTNAYVSN